MFASHLPHNQPDIKYHIRNMMEPSWWGTDLEILALATYFQKPIYYVTPSQTHFNGRSYTLSKEMVPFTIQPWWTALLTPTLSLTYNYTMFQVYTIAQSFLHQQDSDLQVFRQSKPVTFT